MLMHDSDSDYVDETDNEGDISDDELADDTRTVQNVHGGNAAYFSEFLYAGPY